MLKLETSDEPGFGSSFFTNRFKSEVLSPMYKLFFWNVQYIMENVLAYYFLALMCGHLVVGAFVGSFICLHHPVMFVVFLFCWSAAAISRSYFLRSNSRLSVVWLVIVPLLAAVVKLISCKL